jgi:hypothetical protein
MPDLNIGLGVNCRSVLLSALGQNYAWACSTYVYFSALLARNWRPPDHDWLLRKNADIMISNAEQQSR